MTHENLVQDAVAGSNDSSQHRLTIFSLVCSMRAKRVLELGVYQGGTTQALLQGVAATGGFLDSVDIAPTDFRSNPVSLMDRWKFHQTDALRFLSEIKEPYDLVFIDDLHTEDHVCQELLLLEPWLDPTKLVLMHDTMHTFSHPRYNKTVHAGGVFSGKGPYGGLMNFLHTSKHEYEFCTVPVNHGLTILRQVSSD